MSTFDLDAEHARHPDWAPDCRCGECPACVPPVSIPTNIVLGSE